MKKEASSTTDSRTYTILTTISRDNYFDECWSTHKTTTSKAKRGTKISSRFKKSLYKYQYRMYRSWKYNRKTRWKV